MALRDQFLRRWQLLRVLEDGKDRTAEELLAALERPEGAESGRPWSRRTLQRDLAHLGRSGFPLEGVRKGRKVRYSLSKGYLDTLPAPFRPSEWAALYYALSALRQAPGSPFRENPLGPAVSGIFSRLRNLVPAALRAYAGEVELRYSGVIGALREQGRLRRVARALQEASEERRPVRILAARPGEIRRHWLRVDPYLLRYEGGGYHLLGRDHDREALEIWPLQRIESVKVEEQAFQLPLGLDLETALAERLRAARGRGAEVVVRFRAGAAGEAIAAFMEEAFGPTRVRRRGKRGPSEVAVGVDDMQAFRRWILSFGAEAEVVSPRELREAVVQDLKSASERYGKRNHRRPKRAGRRRTP